VVETVAIDCFVYVSLLIKCLEESRHVNPIVVVLRLYDEDSLDNIVAYCQTYLSGYRKYWGELLEQTHDRKAMSTALDNLPTVSQLSIDLNESQGSVSDLPPVNLEPERTREGEEYDLLEFIEDEPLKAPNRVVSKYRNYSVMVRS